MVAEGKVNSVSEEDHRWIKATETQNLVTHLSADL